VTGQDSTLAVAGDRDAGDRAAEARLSTLDRFLPVWILAAMALGLLLGRLVPGLGSALDRVQVGSVSLPIAIGLLVMMYPVLAKVRYNETGRVLADRRLMVASLVINWLLAPAFMFALAWVFLPDLPEYRTGLIIVGLARCIAMVLIWNDLACGDREAAAVLVAVNSVFQVVAFGALGWFYLQVLPARLGPWALYGLLFTIVILFALQGDRIVSEPLDVARVALPLVIYFLVVFSASLLLGRALRLGYPRATTLAFTAAGNNFELAIAVAIATFGVTSGQALAGVVGPLIEVPVLVALVYVARWARQHLFPADRGPEPAAAAVPPSTRGA
jgi:ACR3 family arsenite transporter